MIQWLRTRTIRLRVDVPLAVTPSGATWRTHRLLVVIALVLTAAALLPGCAVLQSSDLGDLISGPVSPDPSYPAITPVKDAASQPDVTITWEFEGSQVSVTVPVDGAVLAGARGARKSALVPDSTPQDEWSRLYYASFMSDQHLAPLHAALSAELRDLRDELGLDPDRHVELILSMVQSLEYQTSELYPAPKFTVETVADMAGDCDDKSLLAAALLAFEGYDVVLLEFSDENHMALGLATDGTTFKSSGYAMVEMTIESLVGWNHKDTVSATADGLTLSSEPSILDISDGPRTYSAGKLVDSVRQVHDEQTVRARELGVEADAARDYADELGTRVTDLAQEMDQLRESGDTEAYNEMVPQYNRLVREYNRAVDAYNELVREQQRAIDTVNRIRDGQTDRYGLTTWLSGR